MADGGALTRPGALMVLVGAGIVSAALAGFLLSFKVGGLILALVLAGCALLRLVLPVTAAGPLAVRSRGIDAATAGVLAVGLAVLAVIAPS